MITKIFLGKELEENYLADSSDKSLENLNQLNILIGANNTGKSRFLRSLFVYQDFKFETNEFDSVGISKIFGLMLNDFRNLLKEGGYEDVSSQHIPSVINSLNTHLKEMSDISVKSISKVANSVITFWSHLNKFEATGSTQIRGVRLLGGLYAPDRIVKNIREKYRVELERLIPASFDYSIGRLYIPILRGLRPTQFHDDNRFDEIRDNYLKRTVRDYFKETKLEETEIFTGLRLYDDTKKMLLGKRDQRDKIKNFETFLSKTFFNNQQFTLIPNIEDDSLHVSIGNEEWPIYKLGDGIQSIIILLYPLFFNQDKKMIVFIEEPENSMHPGLQRLFLETIMQPKFKNFQYFITTHSNHFLDFTIDLSRISVFSFNKTQDELNERSQYKIEGTSYENSNILELLGVRNASVFLSNCTIWVEGITDRLYIKKYLEVYQNEMNRREGKIIYKEDFNYSFIEYGGSNITHWTFGDETMWEKIKANRISSKMFLLADKDSTELKATSEKSKRLILLKDVLGDGFQVTKGREIENLLSASILIKSLKSLEKSNADNVTYNEKKITPINYLNKPLGKFIEANFKNLSRKYQAQSGTIICKLDFCRAVIKNIHNVNDLSPETYNLVEDIYKFIAAANRK